MSVSDNDQNEVPGGDHRPAAFGSGSFLVGPVFLAFAAWIAFGPEWTDVPELYLAPIDKSLISTEPRRQTLDMDPPVMHINNYDRTCMECHRSIKNPEPRIAGMIQHTHIVMEHGPNKNCYICHDYADRNSLVKIGPGVRAEKVKIPFTQIVDLCGSCHGSLVQDWKHGAHGRTNGYWDANQGPVRRLICTECHDPHQPRKPAMQPMAPLPGPNTLRMKSSHPRREDHGEHGASHKVDPLREALKRAIEHRNKTKGEGR